MDIVGLDYPCMDMNLLCSAMPAEGELVPMEDMSIQGGGKVPNALIAAARLGSQCAMIGITGDDRYGRLCKEDLRAHGVDVSALQLQPGGTALCVSIVAGGKKHYIEHPAGHRMLCPDEILESQLSGAKYLMLYQMDAAAVAAARMARRLGVKVVVDADEYDQRLVEHMNLIDVLISSEYFYQAACSGIDMDDGLRSLASQGLETVIVTMGEKGSIGLEKGMLFKADAWKIPHVVDTTGAGDVFHGAFCHYLCQGYPAKDAARLAGAVSAVKCMFFGGRAGIPDEEIASYFRSCGRVKPGTLDERLAYYRLLAWQ